MGRTVKNPFTGEDVNLDAWDAQAAPKPPAAPAASPEAPPPPGAPTWGNQGGTPASDPYQNYVPPSSPALNTAGPAAVAPGPGAASGNVRDALWSAVTQQNRQSLTPAELDQILADPQFAGKVQRISPDVVSINGEQIDLIGDVGGRNTPAWIDNANRAVMARGGAGGGAAGPGGGAAGPASAGGGSDFQNQIRALLLQQLGKMSGTPSINDPELAAQSSAFRAAQERGGQAQRAQAAERAAFTGLNSGGQGSGAFDTTLQGIQEGIGQNTAAFDANLVGGEVQNRRAALQNLLQMALATGDAESARAIQLQIAQMDDALRRATLAQNQSQFNDTFGNQLAQQDQQQRNWLLQYGLR